MRPDSTSRPVARPAGPLQFLLKHDRAMVVAGLLGVTAITSAYLICSAVDTASNGAATRIVDAVMAPRAAWTEKERRVMAVIWVLVMVGMMLPRAAPTILFYGFCVRKQRENGQPMPPPAVFACGCLVAWAAFCFAATLAQWGVAQAALASPVMTTSHNALGGTVLIAAGLCQLSDLGCAQLRRYPGPLRLAVQPWRPGVRGALLMGARHGIDGLRRGWMAMALLFVGGVVNLVWAAAIAVFLLTETLAAQNRAARWLLGAALAAWGCLALLR